MTSAIGALPGDGRIVVTGSRDWSSFKRVAAVLDRLEVTDLGHGNCRGLDKIAERWAIERGVRYERFDADWSLGRRAGPLRNRHMHQTFKPDAVVAFKDGFGDAHGGTEDMVSVALRAGTPVLLTDRSETRWL